MAGIGDTRVGLAERDRTELPIGAGDRETRLQFLPVDAAAGVVRADTGDDSPGREATNGKEAAFLEIVDFAGGLLGQGMDAWPGCKRRDEQGVDDSRWHGAFSALRGLDAGRAWILPELLGALPAGRDL
ncbi:MAG: hypothetical protein KDI81_11190 [Xanthomonadales bacterium]|nr:hypothetical protein [Xanthomonadales bacterium]